MPTVQANGITLYYESHGTGDPLILIAGLGYSHWQWHRMIPGLAEHFRVIAFDNRGAGGSSQPEGPYNVAMLAADTAALLLALDAAPAVVVGHSMGGFIAQELALTHPELISKLVLASTNFGGPNHVPITPAAMQVMTNREGDPQDVIRRGIEVACAPGFVEAHPDQVQALIDYRLTNPVPPAQYQAQMAVGLGLLAPEAAFEGKLHKVSVPTLILFGEHDAVVPPGNAGLLARELPDSQVVILPGAGHMFPIETPDAAVQAIVDFAVS